MNTFLSKPGWLIHALTRNTTAIEAQDLASSRIEVVCANIDDPSTLILTFDGPELGTSPELRDVEITIYPG